MCVSFSTCFSNAHVIHVTIVKFSVTEDCGYVILFLIDLIKAI